MINHQSVTDKVHLYEKDPFEPKYQLLTKKYKERGIKYFKDPTTFIKYSRDIKHRYQYIDITTQIKMQNTDCNF